MKKRKGIVIAVLAVSFIVGFTANVMAWEFHHGGATPGWKPDSNTYTTDVYH